MAAEVVPRDDRAWPRGSLVLSVVLALIAFPGGAAAAVAAAGQGAVAAAWVTVGLVAAAGFALVVSLRLMRRWIDGRPDSGRDLALLWAGFGGAFLALAGFDGLLGGAVFAGLSGGVLVANAWAIRIARGNRALVDAATANEARAYEASRHDRTGVLVRRAATAPVGQVLRAAVARELRVAAAWLVAGVLVPAAGVALGLPQRVTLVVAAAAGCGLLWAVRRIWAARRALRDLGTAVTAPRRAFVIVLHDPEPRFVRPLLGVWTEPPVLRDGRLPRPERVYRCDDGHGDLARHRGGATTYEAWVDTGPRRWSTPRWVVADDGIALPHRPAAFGRWYLSRLLSGERPGPPRPLTAPPPHAAQAAVIEPGETGGGFYPALVRRLALLAAFGLLLHLAA